MAKAIPKVTNTISFTNYSGKTVPAIVQKVYDNGIVDIVDDTGRLHCLVPTYANHNGSNYSGYY